MTEELIAATNKKNGEDRSVSSADKLLTPGSDRAGDLGKVALLPAPEEPPLLEAETGRDERKPQQLLRRAGRYVTSLALRLAKKTGWRSAGDNDEYYGAAGNASGDSESEHLHAEEEELDELTQQRINKIDEEWEFRADVNSPVDGFDGKFVPKSYPDFPDFAGSIASGDYEEIEKLVPNIRELVAKDARLNPEKPENYDEEHVRYYADIVLPVLAQINVAAFFKEHYKHMPKLADSARRAMQGQIDSIRSLKDNIASDDYFDYGCGCEGAVAKLMNTEAGLPGEVTEGFEDIITGEIAELVETAANSMGWLGFDAYAAWLADRGFPPERWPQDARDREDFPEPLRRLVNERDKTEQLDFMIIKYCIERTEIYDDDGKAKPDVYGRCDLIQKYFGGRLPDMYPIMMSGGIRSMVASSSSDSIDRQIDRYNDYIQTIREIGQGNANKLAEELGIMHFSDWSPEVLRGTLHILETGRTESGNPATMIIRGDSGDHNGAAHTYQYIKSTDTYAVEIDHTDMLSGVVERLKRAGVDSNTFNTIVLFGHGSEECFSMSLSEEIPPSPRKWYNKKGMRCLIEALGIDTIVLSSCHPLVQEEGKYEPFTLGEGFQRRRGTAVAISKAFPQVRVVSGLDGITYSSVEEEGRVVIKTKDSEGNTISTMAETRNGRTRVYKKGADRQ